MPAKTNEEIVKFLRTRFLSGLVSVRLVAVVMEDAQLIEPIANSQGHWPAGRRKCRSRTRWSARSCAGRRSRCVAQLKTV